MSAKQKIYRIVLTRGDDTEYHYFEAKKVDTALWHFHLITGIPKGSWTDKKNLEYAIPPEMCDNCEIKVEIITKNLVWEEEDAKFPLRDWHSEVADDNTRQGYWNWVFHEKENLVIDRLTDTEPEPTNYY